MNRNDIIRMAQEAGFEHIAEAEHWHPYFERFYAIAIAAEREACAEICDNWELGRDDICLVAAEIRARQEQPR